MSARDLPDFHVIKAEHAGVHRLLVGWAIWARPNRNSGAVHPMFRGYVPYLYPEREASPVGGREISPLKAQEIERAISALPMEGAIRKRSQAIRWCYDATNDRKFRGYLPPWVVARNLQWDIPTLMHMLHDSREMLSCLI